MEKSKFRQVLAIIFLLTLVRFSFPFKSHFEYYDQVFLNTTTWTIQLTFNLTTLENHATELLEACSKIPTQLKSFKNEINTRKTPVLRKRMFVQTHNHQGLDFLTAKDSCEDLGPTCELATIANENDEKLFLKTLEEFGSKQAYTGYHTEDGDIVSPSDTISIDHYLTNKQINARICPRLYGMSYFSHDVSDCFHFTPNNTENVNGFYYNWATNYCHSVSKGDVFHLKDQDAVHRLRMKFHDRGWRNDWWMHGIYTNNNPPPISRCDNSYYLSKYYQHMYYDFDENCIHFDDSESTHGVVCHLPGDHPNLKIHSKKMNSLLKNTLSE